MFTNDLRTWDIKLGRVVKWIGLCPIHSHNIEYSVSNPIQYTACVKQITKQGV